MLFQPAHVALNATNCSSEIAIDTLAPTLVFLTVSRPYISGFFSFYFLLFILFLSINEVYRRGCISFYILFIYIHHFLYFLSCQFFILILEGL